MGNDNSPADDRLHPDSAGDRNCGHCIEGFGAEGRCRSLPNEMGRNPDTELHLDGEADTLYSDGIDVEEDYGSLSDTPMSSRLTGRLPLRTSTQCRF